MNNCTILRRMKIEHGSMSLTTGKVTMDSSEVVTRACDVPLFTDAEKEAGICRACRDGWEVPDNVFASDFEMWRAKRGQR